MADVDGITTIASRYTLQKVYTSTERHARRGVVADLLAQWPAVVKLEAYEFAYFDSDACT